MDEDYRVETQTAVLRGRADGLPEEARRSQGGLLASLWPERKNIALVTNGLRRPAGRVIADYLIRWSMGLLIKDEKQSRHAGRLGAYRVRCLPPIGRLKADLRRVIWQDAVNEAVKVSHERGVIRGLEKLLAV